MSRPTDGFSATTRVFTRLRVAQWFPGTGSSAPTRDRRDTVPDRAYLEGVCRDRGPELAVAQGTPAGDRPWAREAAARRLRALGQPPLERRPLGARVPALPRPAGAVHGEGRAVQAGARLGAPLGGRVPGAPRRGRPRRAADGGRARALG